MALKPNKYTTRCPVPMPIYLQNVIIKLLHSCQANWPIGTPSNICYTPGTGT